MDGEAHGLKDVTLGYKPCAVAFSSNGNYLLVGGTGKKLQLYTPAGVFVSTLTTKSSWIWGVAVRPGVSSGTLNIACGTEDGSVCYESIAISTVHGLYKVGILTMAAFAYMLTLRLSWQAGMSPCLGA